MKAKKENGFNEHIYAEKALLSAIIGLGGIENIKSEIATDDFYDVKNREVYKTILRLNKEKLIVDFMNLRVALGEEYDNLLVELISLNTLDYRLYMKKVKENSVIRKKDFLIEEYKNKRISDLDLIKSIKNLDSDVSEVKFKPAVNLPILNPTDRINVFGFTLEYSSICIIAGATGTGKTEFTMEIADVHAKMPDCLSILCYYEGNENHIQERLRRKNINNENLLYAIKPSFKDIRNILLRNKDKKVFLVIDYIQKLARYMRIRDKRPTDILMIYIDRLFEYFDDLRNEFPNVCICFLASYSKAGITEMKAEKLPDMVSIANGIKESGDIAYDVDYGYAMFFADAGEKLENDWSIGRKTKDKFRNYVLLYGFKDSRIDGSLPENIYVFNNETKRYDLFDNSDIYDRPILTHKDFTDKY
jgi:hypothetical protein